MSNRQKSQFKKGEKPWNYGKKIPYTPRQKIRGRIPWNKGKKIGKPNTGSFGFGRSLKGSNHWNWKGGITPINRSIRQSSEYRLWKKSVFERDNYTCRFCGKRGGELHADHIKPFYAYPELRFAIDNGRTLCKPCHKTTDTYGMNSIKKNDIQ